MKALFKDFPLFPSNFWDLAGKDCSPRTTAFSKRQSTKGLRIKPAETSYQLTSIRDHAFARWFTKLSPDHAWPYRCQRQEVPGWAKRSKTRLFFDPEVSFVSSCYLPCSSLSRYVHWILLGGCLGRFIVGSPEIRLLSPLMLIFILWVPIPQLLWQPNCLTTCVFATILLSPSSFITGLLPTILTHQPPSSLARHSVGETQGCRRK